METHRLQDAGISPLSWGIDEVCGVVVGLLMAFVSTHFHQDEIILVIYISTFISFVYALLLTDACLGGERYEMPMAAATGCSVATVLAAGLTAPHYTGVAGIAVALAVGFVLTLLAALLIVLMFYAGYGTAAGCRHAIRSLIRR